MISTVADLKWIVYSYLNMTTEQSELAHKVGYFMNKKVYTVQSMNYV